MDGAEEESETLLPNEPFGRRVSLAYEFEGDTMADRRSRFHKLYEKQEMQYNLVFLFTPYKRQGFSSRPDIPRLRFLFSPYQVYPSFRLTAWDWHARFGPSECTGHSRLYPRARGHGAPCGLIHLVEVALYASCGWQGKAGTNPRLPTVCGHCYIEGVSAC